ncbi:hypothetical protein WS70_07495 [Burkholderia mayonis]|uniref:Uncharacterized protein n=1 Tax=Burkholderia mayonis TaxID=1385591 RepID=A0A1B4FDE2_9BURK|nr:hypothetical protein WS70_07495 [Burkholderia mayonis]KVE47454.1 hypothetical protein WS70_26920 [Burkholderia mayonis]
MQRISRNSNDRLSARRSTRARAFSVGSLTNSPCCAPAGSAPVRNVITAYPQCGWDVLAKRERHRRRTAIVDAPDDRRDFAGTSRGVR